MLKERQTVNENSDPASAIHYKFILKTLFVSGYIPGKATKLPSFKF